jgi:ABC-type multidrug transport system fused ATPase/permease subunit
MHRVFDNRMTSKHEIATTPMREWKRKHQHAIRASFRALMMIFVILIICTIIALGITFLPDDKAVAHHFSERYNIDDLMLASFIGVLVYALFFISIVLSTFLVVIVCCIP